MTITPLSSRCKGCWRCCERGQDIRVIRSTQTPRCGKTTHAINSAIGRNGQSENGIVCQCKHCIQYETTTLVHRDEDDSLRRFIFSLISVDCNSCVCERKVFAEYVAFPCIVVKTRCIIFFFVNEVCHIILSQEGEKKRKGCLNLHGFI